MSRTPRGELVEAHGGLVVEVTDGTAMLLTAGAYRLPFSRASHSSSSSDGIPGKRRILPELPPIAITVGGWRATTEVGMRGAAFLFDMAGVLLDFDLHSLKRRVAEASGTPLDHIDRTWRDDPYTQSELGQVPSPEYYRRFAARVRLGWSYPQWIAEWARIVTRNESGAVLSNLAEYHRDAVSYAVPGFWSASSGNFLSYELGLCKPTAAIFHAACASIGKPPQECYFFDDDEANAAGASGVGMKAFRFYADNMAVIRRAVRPYCL